MKQIVPHLWFDKEAKEAAEFYTRLFPDSRINSSHILQDTPSGDAETVDFTLAGQPFEAISAGPVFQFNPSISLMVACRTAEEVDTLYHALSDGGVDLMPLGEYPFSHRYSWVQDRYGLSWQLMLVEGEPPAQKIAPHLLFAGAAKGKAAQAVAFYREVFGDTGAGTPPSDAAPKADANDPAAAVLHFTLLGQRFSAMDHGFDDNLPFTEAFSLIVYCDTQKEIDDYWSKLSHVPEAEACGWLKDAFGVSWQIVPRQLGEMMATGTDEQIQRVVSAFLPMKKFTIATLEKAFAGE